MSNFALSAKKRTILGRKVKQLRKDGLLPANVFGKKIKSQAVTIHAKEFIKIFADAGESVLVDLGLDGKKTPVLIKNVSYNPITGAPVHADLHQVDLKEKVTAHVPLEIIGESPAVKDKIGVLLKNLDELEVEALPNDLPEKIEVEISHLKAIDESVKISDLKIGSGVKILTDLELEIVKIAPLVSTEAEKMVEEQAAAQAAAAAEAAPEVTSGGEVKQDEAKKPEEAKSVE